MNEIATSSNMKRVGDMLKKARERKKLSYEDIYKFIKVHPKYLSALEDGDYKVFSSGIHVKGFLKIYAKLLELNVEEVLAFWRREFDDSKNIKTRIIKPLESPRYVITPNSVLAITTIVLVLGFFSYLYYQYRTYSGAPSLIVDQPGENLTLSESRIEISGRTDRDSAVYLNGQEVETEPDGNFNLFIDLSPGLNKLSFLSVSKLGKESRIERSVISNPQVAGVMDSSNRAKVNLEVAVSKGSPFVTAMVDGETVFEGTMFPDTSRVFEASASVRLKTTNAGLLTLKLNGVDMGLFGKPGEHKEQEFK